MNGLRDYGERLLKLGTYSFAARNPLSVLARQAGLPSNIRLLNGFSIPGRGVPKTTALSLARLSFLGAELSSAPAHDRVTWTVSYEAGTVSTPEGLRFALRSLEPVIFSETFVYGVHFVGPDLTGTVVVDVGAFVGDTALYYAQLGAEVLAFEPDPTSFQLLQENVRLNPELSGRVTAYPAAVGPSGTLAISVGLGGRSGPFSREGRPQEVRSYSLQEVVDLCPRGRSLLLKADCKGSEFDLVRQPALSRFDRILVEFSAERRGETLGTLLGDIEAAGFAVERVYKHNFAHRALRDNGTVSAVRRGKPSR